MKRLFVITNTITGKPVPEKFFGDKMLAKELRNTLNQTEGEGKLLYVVSPGPDHRKFKARRK